MDLALVPQKSGESYDYIMGLYRLSCKEGGEKFFSFDDNSRLYLAFSKGKGDGAYTLGVMKIAAQIWNSNPSADLGLSEKTIAEGKISYPRIGSAFSANGTKFIVKRVLAFGASERCMVFEDQRGKMMVAKALPDGKVELYSEESIAYTLAIARKATEHIFKNGGNKTSGAQGNYPAGRVRAL